jgi:hypothetical protein
MALRYYVKKAESADPLLLDDHNAVAAFLTQDEEYRGEIYVYNDEDQKQEVSSFVAVYIIHYDKNTAAVELLTPNNKGVTNYFSFDYLKPITKPVEDALTLLAKIKLLDELQKLNDEKINRIIDKYYASAAQQPDQLNLDMHLSLVNKALKDIHHLTSKSQQFKLFRSSKVDATQKTIHQAVHKAFKNIHPDYRFSMKNASDIMKDIQKNMQNASQVSRRRFFRR